MQIYIDIVIGGLLSSGLIYLITRVNKVVTSQADLGRKMEVMGNDMKHIDRHIDDHKSRINNHDLKLQEHEGKIATLMEFKLNEQQSKD